MKKGNNKILIGGLAVLAVVGIASAAKKKPTQMIGADNFQDTKNTSSTPTKTTSTTKPLDKNLILKNGSKGQEVSELQKLLSVSADGIFGNGTETALFNKKGVKQISLNSFASTPDINRNPLKAGDRLMASNHDGTSLYIAHQKADGAYFTKWERFRTIEYGKDLGTLKSMDATKNNYSINSTFGIVLFVKAADVKKY